MVAGGGAGVGGGGWGGGGEEIILECERQGKSPGWGGQMGPLSLLLSVAGVVLRRY